MLPAVCMVPCLRFINAVLPSRPSLDDPVLRWSRGVFREF